MGNVHGQASIKLNTIPANTSLLGGHFVYYQGDQNGTVASANVVEKVNNDPAKWGYNTHIGANGLHLRKGIDVKAALTTTGLKIMQGGIEAGAINTEDYIYVWSEDDSDYHTINIGNSGNKSDWRVVAGNKFGVDKAGNLWASDAHVSGAITATSLTIQGSDGSDYSGTAAINISGYNIAIVNDDNGAPSGSTILYPHMYHNGFNIDDNKILSEDIEIDLNKEYFQKVGEDYIKIDSPTGVPKDQNYYEKEIIPYEYKWWKDNQTIGTHGDIVDGHYVAEYGHTYRVTYDFDDGAVEGGTATQYIEVDPSKYITAINSRGIQIHPEDTSNNNSIELNGEGLKILDSNDIPIAKYAADGVQIGTDKSFNLKINAEELGFYDEKVKVAYLNNKTLYITQSVVVDEMRVGVKEIYSESESGEESESESEKREEWSWKYDKSDRSLYLKWIGV